MRRLLSVILFALLPCLANSQAVTEFTRISLLTGSPGAELYSTFGHSAIRVSDVSQGIDMVYNYGTFDFNTPNFYLKFAQGKLLYKLSIETFENFQNSFRYENRSVDEQILQLTPAQKEKLILLLQENYLPENRYYKYDFFFDNCATRIRDLLTAAYGDGFEYQYPDDWKKGEMTFRNLIDLYLTNHHWSDFGIDLALGLPTDVIASPADYMFLPDYLAEGFQTARIRRNGEWAPLVTSSERILERIDTVPQTFFITPIRLMWFLLVIALILSYFDYKRGKRIHAWFDILYFNVIGLVGWMVFLLWFFTDHIATKTNLNLLWAIPINFPLFLFWSKLGSETRRWYMYITGGIDVLILVFWVVFPQQYHVAFIPLILIILMRYVVMLNSSSTKINQ